MPASSRKEPDAISRVLLAAAALVRATARLEESAEPFPRAGRWVFPVEGPRADIEIGGGGTGHRPSRVIPCHAAANPGHPAHDIFVKEAGTTGRNARNEPYWARAVEDGVVLVARDGWEPGDPWRGDNYVLLYLPARRLVAHCAHLEMLLVCAGERVRRGQRLGMVGRTGLNAWPKRSPTHLHLGLWDARTFRPVDSLRLLRAAEWPPPSLGDAGGCDAGLDRAGAGTWSAGAPDAGQPLRTGSARAAGDGAPCVAAQSLRGSSSSRVTMVS
jgi:hypothetical protein